MTTISLYEKPFMLTGENADPTSLDFSFYTQAKITYDANDRPTMKEFYMSYNSQTETFSDLAVKCTFVYTLDGAEVIRREETIEWYFDDGTVAITKLFVIVYE